MTTTRQLASTSNDGAVAIAKNRHGGSTVLTRIISRGATTSAVTTGVHIIPAAPGLGPRATSILPLMRSIVMQYLPPSGGVPSALPRLESPTSPAQTRTFTVTPHLPGPPSTAVVGLEPPALSTLQSPLFVPLLVGEPSLS